jgi:diguanylate cyclase (GGDEF)-like protein
MMASLGGIDLTDWLAAEIAVVDPAGAVVRVNHKWRDTAARGGLGENPGGWNYVVECEAAIMRGCNDAAVVLHGLRGVLGGTLPSFVAAYSCPFTGLHHWYEVLVTALDVGGKRHAVLMHVDVSALQIDGLTGLPNRAMFDAQMDHALATARASAGRTGVVFIDINHLKSLNDVHGHQTGDRALQALADAIKQRANGEGLVARIGGDEFGVVLPVSLDPLFAPRNRKRFGAAIVGTLGAGREAIGLSASVGVAIYPEDGITAGELYGSADRDMYARKRDSSVA